MARLLDNASNQYLSNGSPAATARPIALCGWFRVDEDGSHLNIISIGENAASGDFVRMAAKMDIAGDPLRVAAQGASGAFATDSTGAVSVDTWHHGLAIIYTDAMEIYLDGAKTRSTDNSGSVTLNKTALGALLRDSAGIHFSGDLAEQGVYSGSSDWTDDDAATLAAGFRPLQVKPEDLDAYWPVYGNDDPEPEWTGAFDVSVQNGPIAQSEHAPAFVVGGYGGYGMFGTLPAAAGMFMEHLDGSAPSLTSSGTFMERQDGASSSQKTSGGKFMEHESGDEDSQKDK